MLDAWTHYFNIHVHYICKKYPCKYERVHVDVYNYNPTLNVYIHATDIIDMHALSLYQDYIFGTLKSL